MSAREYLVTVTANGATTQGSSQFNLVGEPFPVKDFDRMRITIEVLSYSSSNIRLQLGGGALDADDTSISGMSTLGSVIEPSTTSYAKTGFFDANQSGDYSLGGVFAWNNVAPTSREMAVLRMTFEFKSGASGVSP